MQNIEDNKERLWAAIRQLKCQRRLPAIQEARRLLSEWLCEHPDDLASRDAGEELAMMEDALEIIKAEKAAAEKAAGLVAA